MTTTNEQVKRLAEEFTRVLKSWAKPGQWAKMVKDNAANAGDGSCASHDFCDANQAMIEAYTKVKGKEPVANDDGDIAFITEAWNLAKRLWQEPELRPGKVQMDGVDGDFECFVEHDKHWNGFACPFFTEAQANKVAEFFRRETNMNNKVEVKPGESFAFTLEGGDDEPQVFAAEEFELYGKLYGIGNHGWCWSEVYPDWNADGTIESEKFGDIVTRLLRDHHGIAASFELAPSHIRIELGRGAHLVAGTMNGLWECDLVILDGAGAEEEAAATAIARESDPYDVAQWLARGHSLVQERIGRGLKAKRKPDSLVSDIGVDPAAVMGIVVSLNDSAKAEKDNISEAYNGGDQFMRECMRVAEVFERWANHHVDFESLNDVWPYLLEDKFGKAVVAEFGSVLTLAHFTAGDCKAIAVRLGLKLNTGGAK